jgi:hypothetical protein
MNVRSILSWTRATLVPLMLPLSMALVHPSDAVGQTIRGHVVDSLTFRRVPLASVALLDGAGAAVATAAADSVGYFQLVAPPGRYQMRVQHAEYRTAIYSFFDLHIGEDLVMEVSIARTGGTHGVVLEEGRHLVTSRLPGRWVPPRASQEASGRM